MTSGNDRQMSKNGAAELVSQETQQALVWKGDFGREYTDLNTFDGEALDALYRENYGWTRTEINKTYLCGIAKDASILEVGCNTGTQLSLLRPMG